MGTQRSASEAHGGAFRLIEHATAGAAGRGVFLDKDARVKCDNCGQNYTPNRPRDYGVDAFGLHYCEACKLPRIEDLLREARGKITQGGIERVGDAVARVREARQAQAWAVSDALTQAAWDIANSLFNALAVRHEVLRDRARQDGTRRDRRPEINEWIARNLKRDPDAKSPALWSAAPDWLTDQIGFRAFAVRVTRQRKMTR